MNLTYFLGILAWLWSLFAPDLPLTAEQLERLHLQTIWATQKPTILLTCLWIWIIFECWLYFLQHNVFRKFKTRTSSLTRLRLQTHKIFVNARAYSMNWNLLQVVSKLCKLSLLTWLIYSDTLFKTYFQTKSSPIYKIPTTDPLTFWSSPGPHIMTLLGWTSTDGFLFRAFLLLITFINLVQLPFSLYSTFIFEPLYRKPCPVSPFKRWRHFLWSHVKSIWLSLLLSCNLLVLISNLEFGEPVNPTLLNSAFLSLVMMRFFAVELTSFVYFQFVNFLTRTHVSLDKCPLRNKITALAGRAGLAVTDILIMKDPKDTKAATCTSRFCGFHFNRRMVIINTLIPGDPKLEEGTFTEDQIEAIFACHLGHWKLRHGIQKNLLECLHLVVVVCTCYWFTTSKIQSFLLIGGLVVSLEYLGCGASGFFINYWKRKFVYEADKVAVRLLGRRKVKHWKSALVKMAKINLEFDLCDPLYKACFHDKPTLRQRVEAVERLGLLDWDTAEDQQNRN